MIDTHLHLLPGVDDGPENIEEALELAQTLVQEGISSAIVTPHYNDEFPQLPAAEIQARAEALQQELERRQIPLRLFAGHEALIKPGLLEDIRRGLLCTLNGGRYLLLELWSTTWLPETERVIFELCASGITPVLAHPERYRAIQQNPARLAELLQRGVLTQLTASSLIGMQGKSARNCAETLLKKGLISCIASDAHGLHRRPPGVVRGLQRARQLLGDEVIQQMTEACPAAILNNTAYSTPPLAKKQKTARRGLLW